MIIEGRKLLPQVNIGDAQLRALSEVAVKLGVVGNRADLFAARAACATAALEGRKQTSDEDLKTAVQLVLLPRATRLPEPEQEEEPPPPPEQPPEEQPQDEEQETEQQQEQEPQLDDLVLSALAAELPTDILNLVQARQQRAKAGSRGETYNFKRGRHVQSVPGKPGTGRIAITATLRAAAPFQNIRKKDQPIGKKVAQPKSGGAGRRFALQTLQR